MAVKRALVFKAGTVGLICAAYEVEIGGGDQDREGTIKPVRDCVNLATERLVTGSTYTGLCPSCAERIAASTKLGVVSVQQRPRNN